MALLIPQPCFDEYFTKYNFFDVPCFKVVVSKALGYSIIAGAVLVKVPQILKIAKAKSAEGISPLGVTLEVFAVTASFCYGYSKQFPFSSYGDSMFLLIQTLIINFLLYYYNGQMMFGVTYTAVFGGIMAYLVSPMVSHSLLWGMQAMVIPVVAFARMIQAFTNYKNGSTGQLSAVTVTLLFFGALARIFTSIQETGDQTIIATFVIATTCNAIIAFQMFYYWGKEPKTKTE